MSVRNEYKVIKRDGTRQGFYRIKLVRRILNAFSSYTPNERDVNLSGHLADMVITKLHFPVKTSLIETMIPNVAAQLNVIDPTYAKIAKRVALDDIYKTTESTFSQSMSDAAHLLNEDFFDLVLRNRDALDNMINNGRDRFLSFHAIKTIERNYALREESTVYERPQYVWARCALAIHGNDIASVRVCYDLISTMKFMPASPIIFNAGTKAGQLSSCFMVSACSDPERIFETLSVVAAVSQSGGGVGLSLQTIPSKGAQVTGEHAGGILPVLKLVDQSMAVISQGMNKHSGTVAIFLDVWHADLCDFINIKRNGTPDAKSARRLFHGLVVTDLFMSRVQDDDTWSLFCPRYAGHLSKLYGDRFVAEYTRLEDMGLATEVVDARLVWSQICQSLIETGGPSILFKDAINEKNNENHLGTITHADPSTEVVQYADEENIATCNLASIVLSAYVNADGTFNMKLLDLVVRHVVLALNRVIQNTIAPSDRAQSSLNKSRAIGIGIQGLADTFVLMGLRFDSEAASTISTTLQEAIQFSAMDESCNLIKIFGTYQNFNGSLTSAGIIQHDQWIRPTFSNRFNWSGLRLKVTKGMANSLLVACMPTSGTSLITGCSQNFEPFPSMVVTQKISDCEYTIINGTLVHKLKELNIWNDSMRDAILASGGSIQGIDSIPLGVRELFKTVWDVDPRVIVKMAEMRGPFVCQSQCMSLYLASPSISDVSRILFQGWRAGLKTGVYRLHTKAMTHTLPITLCISRGVGSNEQAAGATGISGVEDELDQEEKEEVSRVKEGQGALECDCDEEDELSEDVDECPDCDACSD